MTPSAPALWILKTGSTLPDLAAAHGDFEDWIAVGLAGTDLAVRSLDVRQADQPGFAWPQAEDIAGLVITGSHAMVTDGAAWSEATAAWLQAMAAQGLPMLGICYGHQLLAHALGGRAGPHPGGLELGTVQVHTLPAAAQDPLWQALPPQFAAHVVHYQSARQLPPQAVVLAANAHEPHHAFRWGRHVWGVQFHPEFDVPAMQAYVDHVQQELQAHGTAAAPATVAATPWAQSLLPRFAAYAQGQRQATAAAETAAA